MTTTTHEPPVTAQSMLIVDDDEIFRERLARSMRDRGYEVRTAADYDEAIAAARAESPELAVVDLKMPGRSGLELVRDLKAIDAATQIVVLTGYGSIATALDAVRLGAAHYLQKPADADDVILAFQRASAPPLEPPAPEDLRAPSLARAEWEHISRVLSDCGGNISEAARRLGIHRRSLQRKLHKYPPRD
ncbi:MAG: response regulator [Deltaproteobacteria bacterium]|nr:MAG: response regulator [Deltaproteobacteria bacterium]